MIKKKATTASSKTAKKKTGRKRTAKKKLDPAQVREELAGIVKSEAKGIAQAVVSQAKLGELAPAKYLLEMAGVYPPTNDGEQATEEEDCLAKTLLDRLNVSRKPGQDESENEEDASGEKGKDHGTTENAQEKERDDSGKVAWAKSQNHRSPAENTTKVARPDTAPPFLSEDDNVE